jgi:hypothetical protein
MRQPDDYTEQEAAEIESGIEKLQDMSDTEIFKRWHKERMGHPLGVQLGISAVKELEAQIEKMKDEKEKLLQLSDRVVYPALVLAKQDYPMSSLAGMALTDWKSYIESIRDYPFG